MVSFLENLVFFPSFFYKEHLQMIWRMDFDMFFKF